MLWKGALNGRLGFGDYNQYYYGASIDQSIKSMGHLSFADNEKVIQLAVGKAHNCVIIDDKNTVDTLKVRLSVGEIIPTGY